MEGLLLVPFHCLSVLISQTLPESNKPSGERSPPQAPPRTSSLQRGRLTGGGLTLNLNILALVGLQIVGKVGLLGGLGRSRSGELLDVGLSIAGLDGRGLVRLELAQVELLNGVG